jgi:transcriptional accessory protein Tex/SPT6
MSDTYIKNPADFLKVGQKVKVWVTEIDLARKRINLSMLKDFVGKNKLTLFNKPTQQLKTPPRKELYRW